MFKSAKKVSNGYNIPLKEPLRFTLELYCPFGIDVESEYKWSAKFYVPIRPDSINKNDYKCYKFLETMLEFESQIQTYLKAQFPTTINDYFIIQTFIPAKKEASYNIASYNIASYNIDNDGDNGDNYGDIDSGCFFRAKIPVKKGIAETSFTGSGKWETKRTLVPDDIVEKTRVTVDIECTGWWITDVKTPKDGKSVGYTFILHHVF